MGEGRGAKEVIEKGKMGISEAFAHTFTHFNAIHWGVIFFFNQTLPFSAWVILAACKNGNNFHSLKTKQSDCLLSE